MADVLVRDVPDDVLAALDARAGRVGLSRSEYLRRRLTQEAATTASHVGLDDLSRFGEIFSDLANPTSWHRRGGNRLADRQVGARPPRCEPGRP